MWRDDSRSHAERAISKISNGACGMWVGGAKCGLLYSLDDLEDIAAQKGGIRTLLDEKWRKVCKANSPRGLFTTGEMHPA